MYNKNNTCKTDKDCAKDYELSCYKPDEKKDGYCTSKLFCRSKEQCIFEVFQEDKGLLVNYKNVSSGSSFFAIETKPQLIIESCNENEAKNGYCFTRECSKNEECSSGRCVDSVCVTSKNPLYLCTNDPNNFVNVKADGFARDKLTCKVAEQETCKHAVDCMNYLCHTLDGNRICADAREVESTNWFVKLIKFICELLILLSVGDLIYIGVRYYMNKRAYGRGRSDTKVRYEMDEAFLRDNHKKYVELEEIDDYDFEQVRKYGNKL
ncbi:hypothetical protein PIROE2DRAFT_64265 [Piromyces sp. E2]|nr:hypothetical protein PIROE2DRAFT_64265 [Piromyces sp. E2]|eukprot:OUM58666.1 hypothetical protein PIROE2DRAFT_64265 [Piromyces sp. E2]